MVWSALLLVPLFGVAAQSSSELLQKGIELASKGRLEDATGAFEAALRLSPGNADILNNLGVVLRRRGQPSQAVTAFRKALRSRPRDYRIHSNLALALRDAGNVNEAVFTMRAACRIEKNDSCGQALAQLELESGRAAEKEGRIDAAIAAYRRAFDASVKCGECAGALGAALLKAGKGSEAVLTLRKAASLLPDSASVHADLGSAVLRTGSAGEAIPHLQRAVALDPDLAAARLALARALQRSGRADEAHEHLEHAKALDAKNKRVMMARSLVNEGADHLRAGRSADAITTLQRAVHLDPANTNARHNLAVAMLATSRFQDALKEFEAVLAIEPQRPDTLYYAGRVKLTLGDETGAAPLLLSATELRPNDAWAWNALAVAYAAVGDSRRAGEALDRALSIDSANELFRRNRECLSAGCRLSH